MLWGQIKGSMNQVKNILATKTSQPLADSELRSALDQITDAVLCLAGEVQDKGQRILDLELALKREREKV